MPSTRIPWRRPMTGRDPHEEHRTATPLELFFDLCFVVAIAAAAATLHHDVAHGHLTGLIGYAMVFFAIWWAWMNYSWFASAYDTDDVEFRLLTFVIMAGVLVLAAGVPRAAGEDHDFRLLVAGYVIMRLGLVPLWLRVARDHAEVRATALRYAGGIVVLQVLWLARTWLLPDGAVGWTLFVVLALGELALPWFAEHAGPGTPWHRHHIAERYELLTIIVLGEVVLATTQAISGVLDEHGLNARLLALIIGGLVLVFSMWWAYFLRPMVECVHEDNSFLFGYAHYFLFGSAAAVGALLAVNVDVIRHEAHLSGTSALLALAAAVAVYLLSLAGIRLLAREDSTLSA